MPAVPFAELPDNARLWIFAASRPLTADERDHVLRRIDDFVTDWQAHGHSVVGGRELRHNQFLMIAADEQATGVSGCSIDSLFRVLQDLERDIGTSLTDSSRVFFRDGGGQIRSVSRAEFRQLARAGEVSETTRVFDNSLTEVGAPRAGRWEVPAGESWHGRAFRIGAPAG